MTSKTQFEGSTIDYGHPDDIHGVERMVLCQNIMREKDVSDVRHGDDANLVADLYEVSSKAGVSTGCDDGEPVSRGASVKGGRHQTGPKGMLNAYRDAMARKRDSYFQKKSNRHRALLKMAGSASAQEMGSGPSVSMASVGAKRAVMITAGGDAEVEEEEEDDDDFEEDLEFLENFREARMREIAAKHAKRNREVFPKYGEVKDVIKPEDFLDFVDGVSPKSLVVVHIYETFVPGCTALNRYMQLMAKRYPCVLFVRFRGSLTSDSFDHIACPAISAYRGGEVVKSFMRITDEIGERPSLEDFEEFLVERIPGMPQASTGR